MDGPPTSKLALLRRFSARYGLSDALLSLRGLGLDLVDACVPLKVSRVWCHLSIFTVQLILNINK